MDSTKKNTDYYYSVTGDVKLGDNKNDKNFVYDEQFIVIQNSGLSPMAQNSAAINPNLPTVAYGRFINPIPNASNV